MQAERSVRALDPPRTDAGQQGLTSRGRHPRTGLNHPGPPDPKGSTVEHLLGMVNPVGVRYHAFTRPTIEE